MENVVIRTASKNDIPIILGLLYELGRPKPQKDLDVDVFRNLVKKYVLDLDKQLLVAQLDDVEIVGVVSILFLTRLNRLTPELYIPELVVLEKYHNQGIGQELMNYCIKLGKEND